MAFIDWYFVLAIEPSADEPEVRRAYRRAALRYHPDKNPDAEAVTQFDLLGRAVAVLTDPAQRAEFDAARARRFTDQAHAVSQSQRLRELRAKLEQPRPDAPLASDLERLRQESHDHRRALDALLEQARRAPSVACRTLADGSQTFATVEAARAFVDAHPGARLQASFRPPRYTREYEAATLERLSTTK